MKLYIKFLGIHLRSAMQHKAAFFMMMLSQITTSLASLLIVYFLFDRFGQVDGFNFEEVLICYAVVLMAFSLAECFVRGLDVFPRLLGNGQFDRMLVRPRNEVFQVLASTVEFGRIGRVIQAVAVLAYAIPNCAVVWTGARVLTLVMMILGGTVMFAALCVVSGALAVPKLISGGEERTTNNRMELTAVIQALLALREPCVVELYSDSKYVIDALEKGWAWGWRKKGWVKSDKKPALNPDLWELLLGLVSQHEMHYHWVKGHEENEKNNRCDEQAVLESRKFKVS